jgi:hypothetical protein
MNPALGRNLGRWAQVYFTTPPSKREHAVAELLRDLENRSVQNNSPEESKLTPEILCTRCQRKNAATVEFCAFCGYSLHSERVSDARSPSNSQAEVGNQEAQRGMAPVQMNPELERLRSFSPVERERATVLPRRLKFALVGCSLLIAVIFYLVGRHNAMQNAHSQQSDAGQAAKPSAAQSPQLTPPIMDVSTKSSESQSTGRELKSDGALNAQGKPSANMVQSSAESRPAIPTLPATPDGTQELRMAQQYLSGSRSPRDPAEAAKWLWKAVAKQNPTATVLLANLYMKGDGVAKSCEQASLLLTAAAGRHTPGAAEAMNNLQSNGCP